MTGQIKLVAPAEQDGSETTAVAAPANVPNTIDQVRELLYGDAMRHQGRRVEDVQEAMHAMEQRILTQFQEMQTAIDTLARALRLEQMNAARMIGGTIVEMGRQIASMGEHRDRGGDQKSA